MRYRERWSNGPSDLNVTPCWLIDRLFTGSIGEMPLVPLEMFSPPTSSPLWKT